MSFDYRLTDQMSFGKYKGELIRDVMRKDPQYIEWAMDNTNKLSLDDEALDWFAELQMNLNKSKNYRG